MNPQDLNLPIDKWRPGQFEGILNSITSKKRFVGHMAPTGTGKTWMVLGEYAMSGNRSLINVGTKELQNAYGRAAVSLRPVDVRGKSNYSCRATEPNGEFFDGTQAKTVDHGPCQFEVPCGLKESGCLYYDIIRRAQQRHLVIANYAATISGNLFTEGWGHFPTLFCDEAHEIEDWLTNQLSITIPTIYQKALEFEFPDSIDPLVWAMWSQDIGSHLKYLAKKERRGESRQKREALYRAIRSMETILRRMRMLSDDWLVSRDRERVLIQPIWVNQYSEELLFNGSKRVVFYSATMDQTTLDTIGVYKGDVDMFEYPSTFPPEQRPVYYYPTVMMHHGMEAEDTMAWIAATDEIISARLDRKGFVPTGSFIRQEQLLRYSKYSQYMVANSSASGSAGATFTLQKFRSMRYPAILVTPSMTTGISLDGKQCEYTIIPKMPFGSIIDPLYQARSAHTPEYGISRTAKLLLQIIGRAMRDENDQNETFILDRAFKRYLDHYSGMLPGYFWQAFKAIDTLPLPLMRLI